MFHSSFWRRCQASGQWIDSFEVKSKLKQQMKYAITFDIGTTGVKTCVFEISDSIENNSAGVVEVPDLGEYTDVTLRLYSPTIRFIELRPPSVKGSAVPEGLKSMTLSLHNVIPSGEESLIDSGELRYSIYIDRSR